VVLCDPSDEVNMFNIAMQEQGLPSLTKYIALDVQQEEFDHALQSEWFMPDEYKILDIGPYIMAELMTKLPLFEPYEVHATREWKVVCEELAAYKDRNMLDLLRYMVYLVDFMRENKIIWGVGRGSSVSSYVLYLIGVHRIDSVKYNLDWREFLRD
jgi:hypothetical protein